MTEGNPETPPEGGEKKPQFTNEQLAQGIAFLMQKLQEVSTGMSAMQERVTGFEGRLEATPPTAPEPKQEEPPPNLDEMSGSQLANFLLGKIQEDLIKPVVSKLDETEEARARRDAEQDVERAAGRYTDFSRWDTEISEAIKTTPGLSLDDAYTLVRAKNPEKTKEIDAELAKAAGSSNGEEGEPKQPFGGLLPTSSLSADTRSMELSDAGEAAWEETMSEFANLTNQGG